MQKNKNSRLSVTDATRYLANALHEIRTPIQTIIGATELIQETKLDKEQTEYIRQIQFSAEGLLDLANNILDLAKIQSDEFKLEFIPFDISYMTEHIVDSVSIKAFNKGVEVITDIDPGVPAMVTGDSVRVRQIMLNLVSNAGKFTKEGYIQVKLSYKKEKGIVFQVIDTGIGISKDKRKKLFTDYFQADLSTYRLYGGTGLGLSICRTLANFMNGSIRLDSNPGGGSIFTVTLPLSAALEAPVQVKFQKNPESFRILIVDDSLLAAQSLKKKLNSYGFSKITICTKVTEAVSLLTDAKKKSRPFNIVFIDMIMPEMDGWHLAFDISKHPDVRENLSMYMLVPEGQMGGEAKMTAMGWFKGYLYKPVKAEMLLNILKDELSEKESIETLYAPGSKAEKNTDQNTAVKENPAIAEGLDILIAEDHPLNRKLIESFMKKFGANVYLAENGNEAVEVIKNNPGIDMIFMDIFMPEKSGIQATQELRNSGYGGIVVACTANNDSKDFEEYTRIGMNDILVKPFRSEMIRNVIEKWLFVMQTSAAKKIATLNSSKENEQ